MNQKKLKASLQNEIDAKFIYLQIASKEKNSMIADYFRQLAAIESAHIDRFSLRFDQGMITRPSKRARILVAISKVFGTGILKSHMSQLENSMSQSVIKSKLLKGEALSGNESRHVSILKSLENLSGEQLLKIEGRHRNVGGNALRAAVLGANDGLVSNLSLVAGVAGAMADDRAVLIAGIAGMLAGSVSMAMGEWISVKSSQELYQRQIELELEEIENSPEEEKQELILLYKAKGVPHEQATLMADEVMKMPADKFNPLIREELSINPEELKGSAGIAAVSSFLLFLVGAIVPILSYFFTGGNTAIILTVAFSIIALFGIGAAITLFTGRSVWISGVRQIIFGVAAAGVTYLAGYLIGGVI